MKSNKTLALVLTLLTCALLTACKEQPAPQEQPCLNLNCCGECGSRQCMERYLKYGRRYCGQTLWTIGDSIFDFNDNSYNDMVPSIASHLGFTGLYMDNIAGSTCASASNVGIADHTDSNFYVSWPAPDVLLIQRGTNDVYHWQAGNIPKGSAETENRTTGLGSISYVCKYFRNRFPEARIVWATPIYRRDVDSAQLAAFSAALHAVCPEYRVEVFDLFDASGIDAENYTRYLSDGIHPNGDGAQKLLDAYLNYFRFQTPAE